MTEEELGRAGLAHLPKATLAAVRRLSTPVTLRKGRALYYQGDRADRAYLVTSGELRRVLYRSDESTAEIGRSGPGGWVGLAEAFVESLYLTDAVAETASELAAFSRSGILRLLDAGPVGELLLTELSRQVHALHGRVEVSHPLDRIGRYLLDRADASGQVSGTQEEIGAAVGLARETVNRHLSQLAAEGVVVVERGRVRLLDRARLGSC